MHPNFGLRNIFKKSEFYVMPMEYWYERWMETLSVFYYVGLVLFSGIFGIFLFFFLWHLKFPLYISSYIYVVWYLSTFNRCHHGSLRWQFARERTMFRRIVNYFPIKLIKTAELPPDRNYIFGCHPHGVLCFGVVSSLGTDVNNFIKVFPGLRSMGMTLTMHFFLPFSREFLLLSGTCASSKESFRHVLTKQGLGNAAIVIPGGSAEMMEAHPHTAVLNLKDRKGFIRIAISHGASLVPVYCFGENDVYDQVPNPEGSLLRKIQNKCKDILGIPPILFKGRGFLGLVPHRRPIYIVVGQPIEVEKLEDPDEATVDYYHAKYVEGLTNLFEEYKVKLGPPHCDLVLKII